MPKTPLYQRLKEAGRLIAESVGDQFVFTNIIPEGHVARAALRGLQEAAGAPLQLPQLPAAGHGSFSSERGSRSRTRIVAGGRTSGPSAHPLDLHPAGLAAARLADPLAWPETALRRPREFRQAVTLALMHKHLYEYMRDTSKRLDEMIRELRETEPAR